MEAEHHPTSIDIRKASNIAKWGAACAPCATAKAKCIRSNQAPGAKCDRCDRLFKDCADQVHRPRKKRQSKPSRTAQIEERLNGLVNLLRASGEIPALTTDFSADTTCIPTEADPVVSRQHKPSLGNRSSSSFARSPTSTSFDSGNGSTNNATYNGPPSPYSPVTIPESYNSYAPPTCICRPETGPAPPPPDSDETLLAIYQNELTPVFPFVIVPRHISAAQLRMTQPFLMSAIRMVASFRSMKSMRAQMYVIMRHVADHMLLRSERSLDLLMGVVVMLGWYHYHCFMHAQMNNLLSLARCLVGELGLNHPPQLAERTHLMIINPDESRNRTNEERRVLLGVWYLSSSASGTFQRLDSMRYTGYLNSCTRELEQAKEYESDALLVANVKLQHLQDRIFRLQSPDELEDAVTIPRAPLSAYTSAFQSELDKIRANLPKSLRNNKLLLCHIHAISLRLYEPPLLDAALLTQLANSLNSVGPGASSALDIFYQSSAALRTWFDNWLSVPVASYYSIPQPTFALLVYAVTMLGRWAKYAAPQLPNYFQFKRPNMSNNPSNVSGNGMSTETANSIANLHGHNHGGGMLSGGAGSPMATLSIVDPSGHNPNVALAAADVAMNPATPSGSSTTAVSSGGGPPSPLFVLREGTDPDLPAAVAALKARLASQPALMLNIPELLSAIAARAEEANAAMIEAAVEPGAWDNNIWGLGITKVKITIAKLERFAEIVAAGGLRHGPTQCDEEDDEEDAESGMDDASDEAEMDRDPRGGPHHSIPHPGGGHHHGAGMLASNGVAPNMWMQQGIMGANVGAMAAVGMQPGENSGSVPPSWNSNGNNNCSTTWPNDLFDGIDPAMWLDGTGDWGTLVMSSMGSL